MSSTKKENSAGKREAWGRLRKLPSGRWQVRYPGPDGITYTACAGDDKPLTFFTKTDAHVAGVGAYQDCPRRVGAARGACRSSKSRGRSGAGAAVGSDLQSEHCLDVAEALCIESRVHAAVIIVFEAP